jgi:hypothetical protein
MNNYEYYSEAINDNNFMAYCGAATDRPIDYKTFKRYVCDIKAKPVVVVAPDGPYNISTSHGPIKLFREGDLGTYKISYKGKTYPLDEDISAANFDKKILI